MRTVVIDDTLLTFVQFNFWDLHCFLDRKNISVKLALFVTDTF